MKDNDQFSVTLLLIYIADWWGLSLLLYKDIIFLPQNCDVAVNFTEGIIVKIKCYILKEN